MVNSSVNRLEFRLQAERLGDRVVPPEGGTPNDLHCYWVSQSVMYDFSENVARVFNPRTNFDITRGLKTCATPCRNFHCSSATRRIRVRKDIFHLPSLFYHWSLICGLSTMTNDKTKMEDGKCF
jgi:hypothetical protein